MVQPSAMRVELDVRRWRRTFAVHQVQRVATERIACVEDAAGIVRFPSGYSIQMLFPCLIRVVGFRLVYVENCDKTCLI